MNSTSVWDMLNNLRLLLLAGWLGAAIFFSAVVAPSAFKVLRAFSLSNAGEIAGAIVSRALAAVNTSGFIISLILIITAFALKKRFARRTLICQIVLLSCVAAATGIGEWVIARRMRSLRAAFHGPIDQVAASDAGRMAFDALHGYSVVALLAAMIAALIAFLVMSMRVQTERE